MTRERAYRRRRPEGMQVHHWMQANCEIDTETDCWYGFGDEVKGGYRRTRGPQGRTRLVHHIAYEAWVGEIPQGLDLDHVKARGCRHRDCFNPAHLEPVDRRENIMRGLLPQLMREKHAAITHCPQGHPYDEENTEWRTARNGNPARSCRTCRRIRGRGRPDRRTIANGRYRVKACPYGHEYTPENTYFKPGGQRRQCATCRDLGIGRNTRKEAA